MNIYDLWIWSQVISRIMGPKHNITVWMHLSCSFQNNSGFVLFCILIIKCNPWFQLTRSKKNLQLQVHGPISHSGVFWSKDAYHPRNLGFKFLVKSVKLFGYMKRWHILELPIPNCVSLMIVAVTTRHIFFQMVHFQLLNSPKVMCKIWAFFWYIPKSQEVWKKIWSNRTRLL